MASRLVLLGIGILWLGNVAAADVVFTPGVLFVGDQTGVISQISPSGNRSNFSNGSLYANGISTLAFDSNRNLFAALPGTNLMFKFADNPFADKKYIYCLGTARGLAADRNGNLFVAIENGIEKIAPNGTQSMFVTTSLNLGALACDSTGNVFAADSMGGTIYKFSPGGSQSEFATGLSGALGPIELACDSKGNLFVTEQSTTSAVIDKFTPDGRHTVFGQALFPTALAFDSSDHLFMADHGSNCIYEFAPSGSKSTFFQYSGNPTALAFVPVPEPSSFILTAIGGVSLLTHVLRRRRQTSQHPPAPTCQ